MTNPFLDNQQIDEQWEIPTSINEEMGKIEDLMDRKHPYIFPYSFLQCGGYEWAEEIAVAGILSQRPHEEIVQEIFDGFDPTPDHMEIGEMF